MKLEENILRKEKGEPHNIKALYEPPLDERLPGRRFLHQIKKRVLKKLRHEG